MNVQFEYLYRDAGNFKKWGEIVFSNPTIFSIEEISLAASQVLIDQSYFVAEKARVPDLHFADYDSDLDHGWHEFHSFTASGMAPTDRSHRNISDFLRDLQAASET